MPITLPPMKCLPCTVCGTPALAYPNAVKALCLDCMLDAGIAVDLLPLCRGLAVAEGK
jgi:hypothetical protein